jgi:type IV pilus assembly protein PilA
MIYLEKKKKKGFTLIEVIVVIAILAILGAILVPNVLGYRARAEKSNIQTSAKTIVSSIETYNADKDDASTEIGDGSATYAGTIAYATGITDLVTAKMLDDTKIPVCLNGTSTVTTLAQLDKVANGDFSVDSVNGNTSTITITP